MRAPRFHGLKRPKIRQSWNKYNLYNLARLKEPLLKLNTHYQQKWQAKSASRAYHGEQIREKAWERQFSPRLRSVVSMNHKYLAAFDGSEQAEGRGSGKDLRETRRKDAIKATPYMQMTYAPMERRLDTAIFRALFASSARQARQLVVHGAVKVNGKKMIYPGYNLNPGDMFQVEPDRVLYATGAPKNARESRLIRRNRTRKMREKALAPKETEESVDETAETVSAPSQDADEEASEDVAPTKAERKLFKAELQDLIEKAKAVIKRPPNELSASAKRKQEIRAFTRTVKYSMKQIYQTSKTSLKGELSTLDGRLNVLISRLPGSSSSSSDPTAESTSKHAQVVSVRDKEVLRAALEKVRENPIDHRKPYATPWRPRPYMSAFAFIPRYLEVNQNICSAVYLRHPVARPGLAEVPSPFSFDTHQLAFTWYLRRR